MQYENQKNWSEWSANDGGGGGSDEATPTDQALQEDGILQVSLNAIKIEAVDSVRLQKKLQRVALAKKKFGDRCMARAVVGGKTSQADSKNPQPWWSMSTCSNHMSPDASKSGQGRSRCMSSTR